MRPGGRSDPLTPADQQMALYIFKGNLDVGSDGQSVDEGKLIIFGAGDSIELAVNDDAGEAARFLLFGGVPIGEPIARHGPFVMNTREELVQAFEDYQAGKLGEISR